MKKTETMNKYKLINLISIILLLFLYGCGGGGNDNTNNVDSTNEPEEQNGPSEIPNSLWKPELSKLPRSGNYFYLETTGDESRGLKKEYLYTRKNASFLIDSTDTSSSIGSVGYLSFNFHGNERWGGHLTTMKSLGYVKEGFYSKLKSTSHGTRPEHDQYGVLSWNSRAIYCSTLNGSLGTSPNLAEGWVAVDKLTYNNKKLSTLNLRFEYKCIDTGFTFKGAIQYEGDIGYIEPGNWQPDSERVPSSGNYIYLESSRYDYVGQNLDYLYTPENSKITINTEQPYWTNSTEITIAGKPNWRGSVATSGTSGKLSPGLYTNVKDISDFFIGEETTGIEWYASNRSCNSKNGWIAIDNVIYEGNTLKVLEMRFYQDCGGEYGHLYGKVHWDDSNPTPNNSPINPIPESIWKPNPNLLPSVGSYLYFNSQQSSFIGGGVGDVLVTEENYKITVEQIDDRFHVNLQSYTELGLNWDIEFNSMEGFNEKPVGYYPSVTDRSNPALGTFSFSGNGRGGCNPHSWVALDQIEYSNGKIIALDLRFHQRCEFYIPGVSGVFHWKAP